MEFASPLRYPGGKRKLTNFVIDSIIENNVLGGTYVEPFAGGASVALSLLFNECVNKIIINDLDRSIFSFWDSVLNHTEELCRRIRDTEITVEEWKKQKVHQQNKEVADIIDLGFSTFFLNRTNRSGIIKAGIIGGKNQDREWRMDARFNKIDLIKRIEKIALYNRRIDLYGLDAMLLINEIREDINERTLIYFDPPYYNQGSALYVNHYSNDDHLDLANYIQALDCKWMLSYDFTPQIIEMYNDREKRLLSLNYSAANKEKGYEMLAFSNNFIVPQKTYSSITIEMLA